MKVDSFIEFIKFSMQVNDGLLEEEQFLKDAFEGENINDVIQKYIEEKNLDTTYDAKYNENNYYPGTKCLVNYFNIKDKRLLKEVENFFVNLRCIEIFKSRKLTLDEIHEIIFQDIYPSAGTRRTHFASKSRDFCLPEYIDNIYEDIFKKLRDQQYLRNINSRLDFINELAYYMGELEALHPFIDGNGRVIRLYIHQLAQEAGYILDWSKADASKMLEATISSIDGDYQSLIAVFEDIVLSKEIF